MLINNIFLSFTISVASKFIDVNEIMLIITAKQKAIGKRKAVFFVLLKRVDKERFISLELLY
ncbi:MAG: hypothetical protein J0H68_07295 [Sphingobacteriia bacterium]|nr:hypothetical protein [Sphingobacteriia bacterium]